MSTVTVNGLTCGVTYNITAGGTLDEQLVGPRSSYGTITAGPCPPGITSTVVPTTSMTGKEDKMMSLIINTVSMRIFVVWKFLWTLG